MTSSHSKVVDTSNAFAHLETIYVRVLPPPVVAPENPTTNLVQPVVAYILIGVLASTLMLILTVVAMQRWKKWRLEMAPVDFMVQFEKMVEMGEITAKQIGRSQTPRELRRSTFTCLKQIGSGAFGEVWKAILDESSTDSNAVEQVVAAKMVPESDGSFDSSAAQDALLCEAVVMAQIPAHPNIISIIGVITSGTFILRNKSL